MAAAVRAPESAPWCGGQVIIRGETLREVHISLPAASFHVGESITFNISQLTANEGYLNSIHHHDSSTEDPIKPSSLSISSPDNKSTFLTIALYHSHLLAGQSSCHFYSVAEGGLVDYVDKVEWDGREGSVTMPNHVISDINATYKVVVWAHSPWNGVSRLGESAEIRVLGSTGVELEVESVARGSPGIGTWGFRGGRMAQSLPGDAIALYEVDGDGKRMPICVIITPRQNFMFDVCV
jgi:hypothetical protein